MNAAVAIGVAEILASANKASATVGLLTAATFIGAAPVALGIIYAFQWTLAPFRQRREWREIIMRQTEATAEVARDRTRLKEQLSVATQYIEELGKTTDELKADRTFPRGRIRVDQRGYLDTEEGERLVVFGLKVSNWETSRRMNIEPEFVLRAKPGVTKGYPTLTPREVRLELVVQDRDHPPPILGLNPQGLVTPRLYYVARFEPELERDELILRLRDLQSGERLEIAIPGSWNSQDGGGDGPAPVPAAEELPTED